MTFPSLDPYNRGVVRAVGALVLGFAVALAAGAFASDSRRAVEAFVGRLAGARVTDLTITQTLTIYQPDGRHPQSTRELQVYFKPPKRRRVEQTMGAQREVHLTVGDRAWVRHGDGQVDEVPRERGERDRWHLCAGLPRSAGDLLAEWRALGVRDDVSHVVQVRGRPITVIGAGPGDRVSPSVWVDQEYGVVRLITPERPSRRSELVDHACSEHRPLLNGLYFPYHQELFGKGGKLLFRIIVRQVGLNGNLPDALFDPEALRRGG